MNGPDISAEFDRRELASLMTEVTGKWIDACSSGFSPGCLGRLPGDDEAGAALVENAARGEVGV